MLRCGEFISGIISKSTLSLEISGVVGRWAVQHPIESFFKIPLESITLSPFSRGDPGAPLWPLMTHCSMTKYVWNESTCAAAYNQGRTTFHPQLSSQSACTCRALSRTLLAEKSDHHPLLSPPPLPGDTPSLPGDTPPLPGDTPNPGRTSLHCPVSLL